MKRILVACFCLCLFNQSWAAWSVIDNIHNYKIYLNADVGFLFPNVSGSNSIVTGPGWPNDYYGNQSTTNKPYVSIAGGMQWEQPSKWLPYYSLGLKGMYVPVITEKGYVNQYSLPTFRNYNFQYDIKFLNVLATFKADIIEWNKLMPYVMVGAGIANYSTSNYKESAVSGVTPRVSPGYSSNSATNFAYALGLGLDYKVQDKFWVNLEYSYNDFGTVKTGTGANTSSLTGINYSTQSLSNRIKASALSLGVTYFIG